MQRCSAGVSIFEDLRTLGQQPTNRPFGVPAIAAIQVVSSASAIAGWWASGPADTGFRTTEVYLNGLQAAIAVLGLIVAVGLLFMVRWAWPLALFVLSVQLAVGLWSYHHGHPNYITLVLSVLAIFYLNSRDVRGAFGYIRTREIVPIE